MARDIYSPKEIDLIKSLLKRFRGVIEDDESRYGFTLDEFDAVAAKFPDVSLLDESASGCDDSGLVLNNVFAFLLSDRPVQVLTENEADSVAALQNKIRNEW